ncbi:hypothetical protein [Streptomyces sp. NPDC031705]|uniref:hypothetical protein n=1 Tax=Streptomyces sp. NPDC031705 TaxID=3155729 RepID=UPI00340924B7
MQPSGGMRSRVRHRPRGIAPGTRNRSEAGDRHVPLDRQLRSWRELNVSPIDPDASDPYTRCRIIAMNGIEVEAILFSHDLARNCVDPEVKRQLAGTRYIEAQQQKVVNWLLPGVSSVLETTIAYEQVAVDLTSWVARMEPDPYLRQAYEFGVLEDFDHLYRYANLYEMIEHRKAEAIVDGLTEVMPGRPTRMHHRDPADNVRDAYDKEQLVTHEYNECYLYHSFMEQESHPKVKAVWELHLNMELEHLRLACDMMRRHDGRDPEEILAPELPDVLTFEPNKAYLRELLATQMDLTTLGAGYVREAHERFEDMQARIHDGEAPPSDRVVEQHQEMFGRDYRVETEGPHPDPSQRA